MPNKNKPNAFIVFAQSIKPQLINEGHKVDTMAELVSAADPYWKELDEEDKAYYKDMAKNRKTDYSGQKRERLDKRDNFGELIANRVDMVQVKKQRRMKERLEMARQWPSGREVVHERFYLISFSVMLDRRSENIPDCQKIIPCEVAVVEYSIHSGIERSMLKFISPGPIPLGHKYNAIAKSEATHKIPIEGHENAVDSLEEIYQSIFNFIMVGKRIVPPIFCKGTEADIVEFALCWLAYNAGLEQNLRKVCELEGLLLDLESHISGHRPNFNTPESTATNLLTSSVFDYEKNTRCAFHEEEDVKFCALGMVKKWSYFLSDYLCAKAGVTLTTNHLPTIQDDPEPVYKVKTDFHEPQQHRQQRQHPSNQFRQHPQLQQQNPYQQQQQNPCHQQQQNPYQQQQHGQQQQQLFQQQQEQRLNQTGSSPHIEKNGHMSTASQQPQRPKTIGRGRALTMASLQRRPGEKAAESQTSSSSKFFGGRGSRMAKQPNVTIGRGMPGMRAALDAVIAGKDSNTSHASRPDVTNAEREKFASAIAAPPASFAPQPPTDWRV